MENGEMENGASADAQALIIRNGFLYPDFTEGKPQSLFTIFQSQLNNIKRI